MAVCHHCEVLPAPSPLPDGGVLYLAPPLEHTDAKLRATLGRAARPFSRPQPTLLAVPLRPGELSPVLRLLGGALTEPEQAQCKALLMGATGAPSLADLMQMNSLSTLMAREEAVWLIAMVREQRLVTHFQPIVACNDVGRVFGYEALLRGRERDGTLVGPRRIFDVATRANLLNQIERASRFTIIKESAAHGLDVNLFLNFNPATIYDPAFCLRATLRAIGEARIPSDRLVFEVVESSQVRDVSHLLRVLDFYRERGFRVALDDVGTGFNSLGLLSRLRPDFVKLDRELMSGVDQEPYKASIAAKLLELSQELGIQTIAEGVERVEEWQWARAHGADYLQGYLFARPAYPPPRPQIPAIESRAA